MLLTAYGQYHTTISDIATGIYFLAIFSGEILSKFKNREEFKGGLEKRKRGQRRKKGRVINHTLKYLYEA